MSQQTQGLSIDSPEVAALREQNPTFDGWCTELEADSNMVWNACFHGLLDHGRVVSVTVLVQDDRGVEQREFNLDTLDEPSPQQFYVVKSESSVEHDYAVGTEDEGFNEHVREYRRLLQWHKSLSAFVVNMRREHGETYDVFVHRGQEGVPTHVSFAVATVGDASVYLEFNLATEEVLSVAPFGLHV